MSWSRKFLMIAGVCAALAASGGAAWILSLQPSTAVAEAQPVGQEEIEATLAALKPPKRARPLIAIIGINDATETNDYLMPYGILRRADVADITLLTTQPGPVKLYPALTVEPDATIEDFDAGHPDGIQQQANFFYMHIAIGFRKMIEVSESIQLLFVCT